MLPFRLAPLVALAAAVVGCSGGPLLTVPPPGVVPGPGTTPTVISKLSLSRSGVVPILGTLGVFPVYVTAIDQNGLTIGGKYPNPVNVSLNNICDLSLSMGAAGSVFPCIVNGVPKTVTNVGAVAVTAGSQVIYINYDGVNPVQPGTDLSATTSGLCSALTFPGNAVVACSGTAARTRRL